MTKHSSPTHIHGRSFSQQFVVKAGVDHHIPQLSRDDGRVSVLHGGPGLADGHLRAAAQLNRYLLHNLKCTVVKYTHVKTPSVHTYVYM